jgi:hypothetical protein
VTFVPTQTGLQGSTVTATTDGGKQTQFAVSGTGQAEGAELLATPPVLSFQATAIGGHRSEAATFRNGGSEPLTIEKVELPSAPFSVEGAPAKGGTIAAGASILVTVKFDPTGAGSFSDSIGLQTNGGDAAVALSAVAGAPGSLQIDSLSNDFGAVLLGSSLTKSFTITNTGGTAVPITKSKPPLGGEFAPASELPEGTTIQAGESITERVTFAPTLLGPAAPGQWLITGEDGNGLREVMFTGSGVSAPPAQTAVPGPAPAQGISGASESRRRGPLATLARSALKASKRGTVAVPVSCPAWEQSCLGTVALKATMRTRGARRSTVARSVVLTLASGSFVLSGGQTRTLMLHLSAKARALLGRVHLLKATATIAARDPAGLSHTARAAVTIRSAAAAHRTGA